MNHKLTHWISLGNALKMLCKAKLKPSSKIGLILLGMLMASSARAPSVWALSAQAAPTQAVPGFCELAALPVAALPLASDSNERLSPDELLERVAQSYRGLLEFAGDEFSEERLRALKLAPLEKFFEPVPVAEQRSVALNESLTQLGDWVLFESEEHGLTQVMLLERLHETVRTHMEHASQERERVEEARKVRRIPGAVTSTGAIFYRDTSRPKLGEAWCDPSGMIWGDVVRKSGGSVHQMNHAQALEYCQSIGAELPSREDFIRLREYMGARPGAYTGYTDQILPALKHDQYWSSSVHPDDSNYAYRFYGGNGDVFSFRSAYNDISVRCVARTVKP